MKKQTTNPMYQSYKPTDLVNHLNESGTGTLSQTFMPTYLNGTIEMNAHDFLPNTIVMKTAMQELIEHIQVNATKFSLMNTYNILKEIEPYLEKEKEQIIDAFIQGGEQWNSEDASVEYYNQNYNQNK